MDRNIKEASDHISAELEFMHVFISQGLEVIDAAEYLQLLDSVRHQRIFWAEEM